MKSTKTILAVAIVIAGFAYAANAFPPGGQRKCSSPQPEDIRAYTVEVTGSEPPTIIIPEVEGQNGFVLTDIIMRLVTPFMVYQDTGEGPEVILDVDQGGSNFNLVTGIPLVAGSTILFEFPAGSAQMPVTIRGFVY